MQSFKSNISIKTEYEMRAVIPAQKLQSNKDKHTWYHTTSTECNMETQISFKTYTHNSQHENIIVNWITWLKSMKFTLRCTYIKFPRDNKKYVKRKEIERHLPGYYS